MSDSATKRRAFRSLHDNGCFVIPNPWDIGSAVFLDRLGFKALATTSAGFGFSRGLPDGVRAIPRADVLAHIAEIVQATDLPVNADFQSGYSETPEGVAASVQLCVESGVAGLSIEDATGDPQQPLFDLSEAVDRVRAARSAIDDSRADVLLTARAECYLVKHPHPLRESVRRLQAYSEAGADVLFAPGPTARDDIRTIVSAAHPKPVNVLVSSYSGICVADLADIGVRRISVGSALARAAWSGFVRAARMIALEGRFDSFDGIMSFDELNSAFAGRMRAANPKGNRDHNGRG